MLSGKAPNLLNRFLLFTFYLNFLAKIPNQNATMLVAKEVV
jgi:hypothetical protein